jgi:Domain of unknown function (DUF4294)
MFYVKTYGYLKLTAVFFCCSVLLCLKTAAQTPGVNDTIITQAVIYNGDTIEAKTLEPLFLYSRLNEAQMSERAKYNRLRNAVYVTYPYARRAGLIMNDMNEKLLQITKKDARKTYIHSREKELKKEFTNPLTNLSIYQGKVLMKLINRETGNNCYEIIKEYKGGFSARFYQTVAFLFNSNLKQPYNAIKDDALIERFVKEVQRMYGYEDLQKPMARMTAW